MANDDRPVLIYTTLPSLDEAKRVGDALVAARLAACVNMFPGMISIFEWKGARDEANEVAMIIKTRRPSPRPCSERRSGSILTSCRRCSCCRRRAAAPNIAAGSGARRKTRVCHERARLSFLPSIRGRPAPAPLSSMRRDVPRATAQSAAHPDFPAPGLVEHDPEEIWRSVLEVGRAGAEGDRAKSVAAIGITNQRETTIVWERATGQAARECHRLAGPAHRGSLRRAYEMRAGAPHVAEATGLVIDPYFSATKLAWLLKNVPGLEAQGYARRGLLRHGRQLSSSSG